MEAQYVIEREGTTALSTENKIEIKMRWEALAMRQQVFTMEIYK